MFSQVLLASEREMVTLGYVVESWYFFFKLNLEYVSIVSNEDYISQCLILMIVPQAVKSDKGCYWIQNYILIYARFINL